MIKAYELRIGNIINNGFKPVVVKGLDAEGILLKMQIISISTDWYGPPQKEYERLYLAYELAEPIPLTPDILEKCGFRVMERFIPIYPGRNFYHKDPMTRERIYHNGETFAFCTAYYAELQQCVFYPPRIDYVHELQNIFFVLYGEELEVKL